MFGHKRRGPNPWLLGMWVLSMVAVGVVLWQFNNIQPKVLAAVGSVSTPTPMAADYARRGDAAFWQGNLDVSITNYRLAAQQNPANVDIVYEFVRMLLYRSYGDVRNKNVDLPEAVQWADQLVKANPNNPRASTINCFAQVRNDQDDAAVRSCIHALDLNPNDSEAHAYLSMAYYDLARTSSALAEADKAVNTLNPKSIDANLAYARALTYQGQSDQALVYFKRAVAVNERLEFPYYELASLGRQIAIKRGDDSMFQLAIGAYQAVLKMTTNNVKAYTRVCQAYLEKAERTQEDINLARLNCKKATDIDPGYSPAWHWYGEVLHRSRDYEGAIDALKQCHDLEQLFPNSADREPACWWLQSADHFVLGRLHVPGSSRSDCDLAIDLDKDVLSWTTDDLAITQANIVINKCASAYIGQYKTPIPKSTPTPLPAPIL